MQIVTRHFGSIEVAPEAVIHFPLGLLGFESRQRFILIDSEEAAPMRWLQCVDDPNLSFLVVEPGMFFPDYTVTVPDDDLTLLQLDADPTSEDGAPVVACLVAIPEDPGLMTINLLGPLVINPIRRMGKQIVLHDGGYSARQRLLPDPSTTESPALV